MVLCTRNHKIPLSNINILFNNVTNIPRIVQNVIVLITKHYLYVQCCLKRRISKQWLRFYLQEYRNIEEQIAINNNKLNLHKTKWSDIEI